MTDLKPFIDALKAAFNDDTGFLDSNYTDIGDDDVSRVVLDGEWDFAAIAYALHEQGFLAPAPPREEWSTYDPNNTGMWGRTNFRADSEEQARELAFNFGYQVHRRLVLDGFKTNWEEVQ